MKETAKTIFKKLISAILIVLMLSSYFPMLVLANDEETENTQDYITLDVNWKNSTNLTEGKLEAKTESSYGFEYNLKFNGVPTGFQNVVLSIKDSETTLPVQISTNSKIGSYARVEFGNQNTGVELNNEGSVTFKKNDTVYEKEVVFRVEASYIDPIDGETKTYVVEKSLKANVTPKTQITNFDAIINMQLAPGKNYYLDATATNKTNTIVKKGVGYERNVGWYSTELTTTYPIHIDAYTYTQTAQLVVTINRIVENESKMAQGYEIDWDGLDEELGTPTSKINDDGSVTYTFTRGEASDTFVKEDTFSIDNDFNVTVTYPIQNTSPEDGGEIKEPNTKCFFNAELNATGFKIVKEYKKELNNFDEVITKETKKSALNKEKSVPLAHYTPGEHAWISIDLTPKGSAYLEKEDIENIISTGSIDLTFNAEINNDYNVGYAQREEGNGYINFKTPQITYLSDEGEIIRRELTASEMRLKSIKPENYQNKDSAIVIDNQEINFSSEYAIAQGTNVNNYSIIMRDYLLSIFTNFYPTYTLNANELGLSETELENILSISIDITPSGDWVRGYATATYYNTNSLGNKYSYMEVDTKDTDFSTSITNTQAESKTLKIRMYKNTNVIRTKELSVVNENPVFYVQLPSMFSYSGKDFKVTSSNTEISIDKISMVRTANKEQYLVIYCEGTYDSSVTDEIDINVTYKRTLKNTATVGTQYMNVYMITDNERYFNESSNSLQLKKGEEVPEKIMRTQLGFEILAGKVIQAHTNLENKSNDKIDIFKPNPANTQAETSEISMPLVMDKDDIVTIHSELECQGDTLSNISILARLPKANNTYTYDTSLKLIADDYKLPDEFYAGYGDSLNPWPESEKIPQIDLTNIQNLQVYLKKDKTETILDSSKYTIYYTTTADVTMNTDISEYQVYTEGADLSQAKNIKVVFAEDVKLAEGEKIGLKYDATMPDAVGMSGATTAAQYTKLDGTATTLDSPAAYVVNGNTTGDIVVTKKFEGYNIGVAPNGVSLEGIEFKLKYYDEATNENKFLQDENGNDVVASTNASGVATFTNVPYGEYYIHEVTTFERFEGIGDLAIVNILPGEKVNYEYENKIKHGDFIINKLWEDTDIQQGTVTFKLEKWVSSAEKIEIDPVYITTNEDGVAIASNLPYGWYKITEIKTKDGWYCSYNKNWIELKSDSTTATVTNKLSKGILQIVKTVPETETVDGLKFHISGLGKVNYINKNGEEVLNNTDLTVTIGEDYSSNENITVEIQENETKAIITIKNLPLGYYHIEEIEMPVIDVNGTNIEKYVTASAETELTVKDETKTVNIKNQYKYGYIQINKTAKLKEGDTYTDIGDLSKFEVRITGTSFYGNAVDKTIQLDEDGKAFTKVEIGKYTITEVAKEGYTTYYGEDATASTTPPEVTVDYNKTTIQKLYNEHTGVGYVRVEKTLEGVTDPQTVIDAGIEFVVVGQNVAGGRVESKIKIDKIDTAKNVAYGVSEAISAGGEYELREVESTIPNFYEGIEPVVVDIKTAHTQEAPLVINAVDPRTKGNLEIITTTYPEGGPLFGITYRVTEVKINQDGTYTKIGTAKELEGNNDLINTSFAEMKDIYAGYYLVEQLTVPDGWIMDLPQIVEVPSYNTGYATFEITKKEKLKENKVTINKVILNSNNEVATAEEIAKAKLNEKESFEIKIKNVDTLEEYYAFASTEKPGIIQGIEAGTYSIEEVYKPKYITEGYYNHITIAPNGDLANLDVPGEIVEEKIAETEGKYLFTITEDENGVAQNVTLTVKNKINTNFGFGGQDLADNYSLVDYEEQQIQIITKAVIYVVDENNNAISGAKFKLVNSEGSVVSYGNRTEFEVDDKKLTIRGLDVGKYTLVCTAYPDGYLKPDDKVITVYSDAVEVARVEIQKNVPRGSLMLSTVYKTDENETKYTSRSKYKVVDKDTGELLTFQRTATGDYKKSNLPDASPVIVLKSGAVEVEGIEIGNYEVGIVDVTKGYGLIKTLPEEVTVVENDIQKVSVEVAEAEIVQVEAGYYVSIYLNNNGELFAQGIIKDNFIDTAAEVANRTYSSQAVKIKFPEGVKIAKFSWGYSQGIAIDTEGRVWVLGRNYDGQLGTGNTENVTMPICITDTTLANEYNNGVRFVDAVASYYTSILLDNEGRIWTCGDETGDGTSNSKTTFECITNIQGDLKDAYEAGIKIEKIAKIKHTYTYSFGLIDTEGKVWMWGTSATLLGTGYGESKYSPVCISETTDLKDVKVKDLVLTTTYSMALDNEGYVWIWGHDGDVVQNTINGENPYPTKVDSSYFGNAKIKLITGYEDTAIVVDEFGKVWTWGDGGGNKLLGNGSAGVTTTPTCISDEENETLYNHNINDIVCDASGHHVVAIDNNSIMFGWGHKNSFGEYIYSSSYGSYYDTPTIIDNSYDEHLEYNVKFKEVYVEDEESCYAIDEQGQVWVWGYNGDGQLGISTNYNYIPSPERLELPGNPKIKKISSYSGSVVALSEDGRVFAWGSYTWLGDGSYIRDHIPVEITNNLNLSDDVQLVDICYLTTYNIIYAIDSEGKVYVWGDTPIQCISDDDNELLKGKKIVKLSRTSSSGVLLLEENGDMYHIYYNYLDRMYKISKDENVKFVKVIENCILDNTGKLWGIEAYSSYANLTCISDELTNPLYKNHQLDPEYKIIDIYEYGIIKDSNGDLWDVTYSSSGSKVVKLEGDMYIYDMVKTDLMPKEIISLSGHLLVDKYGQIWVYQNVYNSCYEAGIGTNNRITEPICLTNPEATLNNEPVFKANNTVINVPVDNELNGIKVKELVNDNFVIDENDNVWYFTSAGKAINLTGTYIGDKNPLYGKQIVEVIDNGYVKTSDNKVYYINAEYPAYVMDLMDIECEYVYEDYSELGKECYIALDKDGNIWTCGVNSNGLLGNGNATTNDKPVCLNAIEETAIYEEEMKDNNFKFEKVEVYNIYGTTIVAIDSYGRLWSWGEINCATGSGSSTDVLSPVCLNDIKETDLYNAYAIDNSIKFVDVNEEMAHTKYWYATDNTGDIWYYDENTDTLKRFSENIATGQLKEIIDSEEEFKIIKTVKSLSDNIYYCIGDNGKIYYLDYSTSEYKEIPDMSNVQNMYAAFYISKYSASKYTYTDNYLVEATDGLYHLEGYATKSGSIISDQSHTVSKITSARLKEVINVKITSSKNLLLVLDTDGKIWMLGYQYAYLGYPSYSISTYEKYKCISEDSTHALYGKQIDYIGLIKNTMMAIDFDGNLYTWSGVSGATEPTVYTNFDEIVAQVYGESTNENKIKLVKAISAGIIKTEKGIFKIEYANAQITCTKVELTGEYINGLGNINQVVGEKEVQTEEGTIYRITPEGTSSYTIEETTTTTLFATPEIEEKQIEGANIIKQTTYKALDDAGKLYVWGDYTGISNTFEGVLCLTDEQYYVAPIYSKSNGWSVIKNQF